MNALLFVSSTCGAQEFALKLAHEATILTPSLNFYLLPKVDSPILETRFKGETISLTPQSVQKINDAFVEHRTKDLPPFIEAINRIGGISYVKWDQLEIHFNNQTELLQNH